MEKGTDDFLQTLVDVVKTTYKKAGTMITAEAAAEKALQMYTAIIIAGVGRNPDVPQIKIDWNGVKL